MGKAFKHSVKSGRNKNDFYPTHHSLVWQLMDRINMPPEFDIHDPAAGNWDIIKAFQEYEISNNLSGKDISTGDDFLVEQEEYDVIFTNPPFSLADQFLQKAIEIARESIIFLLPLDYLHGKGRYDLFYNDQEKFQLTDVYVLVRRPMFTDCVRDDGCYNTGSVTFAWFIWQTIPAMYLGPRIGWIDNNKYVIGSKKEQTYEKQGILF